MTRKTMLALSAESGEIDLRGEEAYFRFSCEAIAREIGGCRRNIAETIQDSGFDYVHKGSFVFVWLDDLTERLEAFYQEKTK